MAFRFFKHEWLGTDYTNHDGADVKDCVKKLIDALVAGQCGWTYDSTHCPENEPILLQGTNATYAAFIIHQSGAKAMIGYSLNGNMLNQTSSTSGDTGFLKTHTIDSNSSATYIKFTGLFFSFITADSVNNGSNFHPEYSILNENFYDTQMSPIACLAKFIGSSSITYAQNYKTMINNIITANTCKHFLMADTTKPILYLGSKYENMAINAAMFGEIADGKKRYDYDIRPTSSFRLIYGGSYSEGITSGSSLRGENTAHPCTTNSSSYYKLDEACLYYFNTDGFVIQDSYPCVIGNKWNTPTPRTLSDVYDSLRCYNENIKACLKDNLTQGEVYNNSWCCIGDVTNLQENYLRSMTAQQDFNYLYTLTDNVNKFTLMISWDNDFNQGNRLG